jgi:hypothetical protein
MPKSFSKLGDGNAFPDPIGMNRVPAPDCVRNFIFVYDGFGDLKQSIQLSLGIERPIPDAQPLNAVAYVLFSCIRCATDIYFRSGDPRAVQLDPNGLLLCWNACFPPLSKRQHLYHLPAVLTQ